MAEHQELGILGHLAPDQHRQGTQQAAYEQVDDRNDHSAMIPACQPAQAQSGNRALQAWLRVFQLPSYAPDLNPMEGIWSVLKRGALANLAVASFAHLLQVIRHGLKKIQYQPGLIEGCLAGTGLSLELAEDHADTTN